jgi:kumamolisin
MSAPGPSSRGATLWGVAALVVLLLAPAGATALALGPVRPGSAGVAAVATPGLPSVLGLPWSERAGYSPSLVAQVRAGTPSQATSLRIVLSLTPRDPSFYQPLALNAAPRTFTEIRDLYAPPAAQVSPLLTYLTAHGLTLDHAWPDGLTYTMTGSAASIDAAFATTVSTGTLGGRTIQYTTTAPSLPAPFESLVQAVSGLASGAQPFVVPFATAPLATPAQGRTTTLVTPSAVHALYGLNGLYNFSGNPTWPTNLGIALVLWGDGYAPSDLTAFFNNYYPPGFPAVTVEDVPIDGAPPASAQSVNDPSNVTSEMTLDLEWAGSAAPGAHLYAVHAPDGPANNGYSPSDATLEDALNTAINTTGVEVVSMSFGTPDGSDPPFQVAFTNSFIEAQQRGLTVLAASGDTGGTARLGCQGGLSPEFPAASPWVVAVGGSAPVLSQDAFGAVTGIDTESAWNRSGGGFSAEYGVPSWQLIGTARAPVQRANHRGLPDVAGPSLDNMFYFDGARAAGAGTSFAAPLWAGMVADMDALHGRALGFLNPRLYAVGAAETGRTSSVGLVDITTGSNCLGPAQPGWDTATGWGTPRGAALYEDLSGTFVNVTLTVADARVAPGGTVDASAAITNASSHRGIGALLVTFTLQSIAYVGPCGGTMAVVTTTTDAQGNASAALAVPGCFFGGSVELTATVTGGSYFGSNTTVLQVNLLGLAGFLAIIQQFPYNVIAFGGIIGAAVFVGWRVGNWRTARLARSGPAGRPTGGTTPTPPSGGGPAGPSTAPSGAPGPRSTAATAAVRRAPAAARTAAVPVRRAVARPPSVPARTAPPGAPRAPVPGRPTATAPTARSIPVAPRTAPGAGPSVSPTATAIAPAASDAPTVLPTVPDHLQTTDSLVAPAPVDASTLAGPVDGASAVTVPGPVETPPTSSLLAARSSPGPRDCFICGAPVPEGEARCPVCQAPVGPRA